MFPLYFGGNFTFIYIFISVHLYYYSRMSAIVFYVPPFLPFCPFLLVSSLSLQLSFSFPLTSFSSHLPLVECGAKHRYLGRDREW